MIGQETGVLYNWETSSGCKWKPFGDDALHAKYKGEIKNGEPNGLGMMYNGYPLPDGLGEPENFVCYLFMDPKSPSLRGKYFKGKYSVTYVGEWENGHTHGEGKYRFNTGVLWTGDFKKGLPWNIIETNQGRRIGRWVNGVKQK